MKDEFLVTILYHKCRHLRKLVRNNTGVSDPNPRGCDCDVCLGTDVIELDDYCPPCIYKGYNLSE